MKIKINVTREDIMTGVPEDPSSCPVAHAMRRAFTRPDIKGVYAWDSLRYLDHGGNGHFGIILEAKTPQKAKNFMEAFDADPENVAPFSFVADFQTKT